MDSQVHFWTFHRLQQFIRYMVGDDVFRIRLEIEQYAVPEHGIDHCMNVFRHNGVSAFQQGAGF